MTQKVLMDVDGVTREAILKCDLSWRQRLWNWFLESVCRRGTVWQTASFDKGVAFNGEDLKITYTVDTSQPVAPGATTFVFREDRRH
jgi:hypothetical protein